MGQQFQNGNPGYIYIYIYIIKKLDVNQEIKRWEPRCLQESNAKCVNVCVCVSPGYMCLNISYLTLVSHRVTCSSLSCRLESIFTAPQEASAACRTFWVCSLAKDTKKLPLTQEESLCLSPCQVITVEKFTSYKKKKKNIARWYNHVFSILEYFGVSSVLWSALMIFHVSKFSCEFQDPKTGILYGIKQYFRGRSQ